MKPDTLDKLTTKRKFVAIFISTAIIGVILIFIAVYNASTELEIINEIDHLYSLTESHVNSDIAGSHEELGEWIKAQSTDEYQFFVLDGGRYMDLGLTDQTLAPYMSPEHLEQSRINERGGYISTNDKVITWARIPLGDLSIIVAREFSTSAYSALAYVYPKHLLIPTAFYIWMTAWGTLILGFLLDRLRSQKQAMEHMALHDALTQLPNRNLLTDRISNLIQLSRRQNTSFALALVDVDEFKRINDTLGHEEGDSLLKLIATRLKYVLREHDTVARFGGDEFTILMPNVDEHTYMNFFSRVVDILNNSYDLGGKSLRVGCSIGVAIYPQHGGNVDELMRSADRAMYKAKSEANDIRIHQMTRDKPPLNQTNIYQNGA